MGILTVRLTEEEERVLARRSRQVRMKHPCEGRRAPKASSTGEFFHVVHAVLVTAAPRALGRRATSGNNCR